MRPDRLYLLDIIEAADRVDVHLAERDRGRFLSDVTRQSAVLHELTVIGEAAGRLSEALRHAYPGTPWAKIVSFRNVVVHEYFGLNWEIVWDTATELVPTANRGGRRVELRVSVNRGEDCVRCQRLTARGRFRDALRLGNQTILMMRREVARVYGDADRAEEPDDVRFHLLGHSAD
jgi:uncharacterized protein with HEPN domain